MCKHINLSFESSSTKVFMEILMFTIQKNGIGQQRGGSHPSSPFCDRLLAAHQKNMAL